ncbi:hypothetical protein VII00023_14540 [Vibrio ichthyoenteri ATCC 700023]|uniref:DUF547 domain-containing protein n=1 Tax=Vibrio ichthyoenteri ATCC 700023 TaxID=870968 RepID=F9RWE4_9VIBR|nr:DUF547 domain-containing protein [Vibrio ichthyoenteri]EGU49201.1 hypothetical protein VII00023_14540 [Vibrio ichthyoenteri ATCC 700023]
MKTRFALSVTLLALPFITFSTQAAPKSELWPYWQQSNENNHTTIDHQAWQEILDQYLSISGQNHLFAYQEVKQQDKQKLDNYIAQLSQIDPRNYSQAVQYAYWVNLYNAVTVDLILDAYPVKSITKLGGFFSFGPWDEEVVTIEGKQLTLNDIEHRILRPIWNDPRTHYAVNCASLGCPNLQTEAFTAKNTEILLEQAAKDFINSPKGVNVSEKGVILSSIYDWFSRDFAADGGVITHIESYRSNSIVNSATVTYDYDWSLNKK